MDQTSPEIYSVIIVAPDGVETQLEITDLKMFTTDLNEVDNNRPVRITGRLLAYESVAVEATEVAPAFIEVTKDELC
jgi:ABC-type uncharacterized transport system auxiliary subunit